jgi:hypothetical protein
LKKTLPIACSVLSGKATATEISMGANMHAPMHPADKFEASKELVEKGIPASAHAYSPMVPVRKGPLGR